MSQHQDGGSSSGKPRSIPPATVARLAAYEQVLNVMGRDRAATSSEELAAEAGVSPATLRKDLSYLGTHGIRGVGYDVAILTGEIGRALGAHRRHCVALVGVGNLGAALANYPGFASRGLTIGALFDVDPQRIGQLVGGVVVDHVENIESVCRRAGVTIGVIATPENAAQSAANALVAAGIDAILAFTPGVIQVPDGVELRKVDLAIELQILAFHASQRTADLVPATGLAPAPGVGAPDLPEFADLPSRRKYSGDTRRDAEARSAEEPSNSEPASAAESRRLTAPLTRSVS